MKVPSQIFTAGGLPRGKVSGSLLCLDCDLTSDCRPLLIRIEDLSRSIHIPAQCMSLRSVGESRKLQGERASAVGEGH